MVIQKLRVDTVIVSFGEECVDYIYMYMMQSSKSIRGTYLVPSVDQCNHLMYYVHA